MADLSDQIGRRQEAVFARASVAVDDDNVGNRGFRDDLVYVLVRKIVMKFTARGM